MRTRVMRTGLAAIAFLSLAAVEARASAFTWPATGQVWGNWYSIRSGGRQHQAIDICSTLNSRIYAARGGYLSVQAYSATGYGNYVKVDHDAGYRTVYAHMNGFYGGRRAVRQGDQVGWMGKTGAANGVIHVHWEVQRWGVRQYVPADNGQRVTAKAGINWNFQGL